MADERVVIKIDINADTSAIDRVQRKLRALAAEAEATNARMRGLNTSLDDNADAADRVDKSHGRASKSVRSHGSEQDRFSKRLKKNEKDFNLHEKMVNGLATAFGTTLKFGLMGAGIEMAAMAAALASVNGLMGIGQMAMKAYRFAMSGVAAGAAAGVIAISTLVAAQREYNGAISAFQYKSAPQLGKGTAQAMSAMRNLTSDTRLGVFGMKNLNAAFAAVSKNAEMTGGLQNALAGLGDFAVAAGGDIGKNITAAADFLGLLKKEGSLTADVLSSASKVGPEFSKAIEEAKKKGLTGADEIISALSSGDLAKQAGLEGALSAVNDTLIGQLKSFMTGMQTQFGDLGQQFLPQVKTAFAEINSSLQVAFTRMSGALGAFGGGSLIEGLVTGLTKVIDISMTLFEKYLPMSKNMFSGVGSSFDKARKFFTDFKDVFKGFSEGGKVMTDTFGPPLIAVLKGFGESFSTMNRLAVDNKEDFIAFGGALTNVFTAIQDAFNGFKELVVTNLPGITKLFNVLAGVVNFLREAIEGVMSVFKGIGGDAGGSLGTLALIGGGIYGMGKMKNFKAGGGSLSGGFANTVDKRLGRGKANLVPGQGQGGISQSVGTMYVTAATVNLTQGTVPGKRQPGINPQGGVGSQPYGPTMPGKPPPPPPPPATRRERLANSKTGQFVKNNGGTMASMAGLAALYGGASEEAQPFITAGSALAFMNPQAGLGVAGLGTALTAKTALGGMASGAMGGAAIGSMFGPWGTAIGGGLGATAGGLSGLARQTNTSTDPRENSWWQNALLGNPLGAKQGEGGVKGVASNVLGMATGSPLFAAVTAYNDMQERDAVRSDVKGLYKGKAAGVGEVLGKTGSTASAAGQVKSLEKELVRIEELQTQFNDKTIQERKDLAENLKKAGDITGAEYDIFSQEHMGTYIGAMRKQYEAVDEMSKVRLPEYDRKTKALADATGTSAKEIGDLALKMGVDLTDGTMQLSDAMEKLGLATIKTRDQLRAETAKDFAQSIEDTYGKRLQESKANEAINQAAEGLAQTGPGFSADQYNEFMMLLNRNALSKFGGDAVAATRYVQEQVGSLGGQQFGEGKVFGGAGMAQRFQELGAGTDTSRDFELAVKSAASVATKDLTGQLLAQSNVGMSAEQSARIQATLEERIRTNAPGTEYVLQRLNEIAQAGGIKDANGALLMGEAQAVAMQNKLLDLGFGEIDLASAGDANKAAMDAANAMSSAAKEMGSSVSELLESQPNWWNNAPSWYNDGSAPAWMNDTSSPRAGQVGDSTSSRLGRTMSRHGFLDSQLAGSRTVTSSWRNTGLGSINSDHVTGNAYDLTGQNLGAYSSLVNGSGGFAEFHGAGGSRHLHVVPGQSPVGDSMSPVGTATVASGGSTSYSIVINAQAGQDANAIAREVMTRIEERDRSRMERS